MIRKSISGLSAIELVVGIMTISLVVVILLSVFLDRLQDIKIGILRGFLGEIRTAIAVYRVNEITLGIDQYPKLRQLQNDPKSGASLVMQGKRLPGNLFSTGSCRDCVALVTSCPHPQDTQGAWAYNPLTGEFFANTASGAGEENL